MKKSWTVVAVAAVLVLFWQARVRRSEHSAEASAIGSLSAIVRAQSAYAAAVPGGGYAARLKTLATPCPGSSAAFLSSDLVSDPATKSGYEITLHFKPNATPVSADCHGATTFSGYYATAKPLQANKTAFAVDESGTLWSDASGVPPTPPFREHDSVKRLQ